MSGTRIALVGAGRMGSVHLRALRAASGVELAGVVEPVAAVRAELAAAGLTVFESVDQLLERGGVDGVLIAAPSDRHAALVARFAAAGVSMMCEKPLGVRIEDAMEATAAAEAAGVVLQVGYWRRFVPSLRTLRRRIAEGELGVIYQLACMQWDAEPPSPDFAAHSGGIAIDMGVHEFDQIRWLAGQEPRRVSAVPGPPLLAAGPRADFESAVILAELSGGIAATVSLGRRFPYNDSCWVEVWGSEGYERLPFMWDAAVWSPGGDEVFLGAMVAQAESFACAVRGEPREGAGGEDAIAALAFAERATAALTEGKDVVLSA